MAGNLATLHPTIPVTHNPADGDTPFRINGVSEGHTILGSLVQIRLSFADAGRLSAILLNSCGIPLGAAPSDADKVTQLIHNMVMIRDFVDSRPFDPNGKDTHGYARISVLCHKALEGLAVARG